MVLPAKGLALSTVFSIERLAEGLVPHEPPAEALELAFEVPLEAELLAFAGQQPLVADAELDALVPLTLELADTVEPVHVPSGATATLTLAVLFARLLSVELADSPTVAVFVIVDPAVPVFAVAAICKVAVELAAKSPMVQVPVELA
jgi:hypothetical protein